VKLSRLSKSNRTCIRSDWCRKLESNRENRKKIGKNWRPGQSDRFGGLEKYDFNKDITKLRLFHLYEYLQSDCQHICY
jgi:hypothetical protein